MNRARCFPFRSGLLLLGVGAVTCTPVPSDLVPNFEPILGTIKPDPCGATDSVELNGACTCTSECAGDLLCIPEADGPPRGACTTPCRVMPPDGGTECPSGSVCRQTGVDLTLGICRKSCLTSAECRAGQYCDGTACQYACTSDDECSSGSCNAYSGRCVTQSVTGKGLFESCLRNEDCRSGFCYGERCVTLCGADINRCPAGGHCVPSDPNLPQVGICLASCTQTADCQGLDCVQVSKPYNARVCFLKPVGPTCKGRTTVITELAPCGCAADCAFGASCISEAFSQSPGGICVRRCPIPSGVAAVPGEMACGGDAYVCAYEIGVPGGACAAKCTSSAECPPFRVCSSVRGCVPLCQADSDCTTGPCNPYRGWCDSVPNMARLPIGSACTSSTQCRGPCRRGLCTAECSRVRTGCPENGVCFDDGDGDDLGLCGQRCAVAADCRAPGAECEPAPEPHCVLRDGG